MLFYDKFLSILYIQAFIWTLDFSALKVINRTWCLSPCEVLDAGETVADGCEGFLKMDILCTSNLCGCLAPPFRLRALLVKTSINR